MALWNTLKWILAFAIGFVVLSDGSFVFFHLVSPLSSMDAYGGLQALEDQTTFLVAATAAGNLLLSLLAGYAVGVISNQHWRSNCVAVAVAAVALTGWQTGFFVPLVNSSVLVVLGFDAVLLSLAPVPLGLVAGGYARSRQTRARQLGAFFAALAVAIAIALRLFLTSVP